MSVKGSEGNGAAEVGSLAGRHWSLEVLVEVSLSEAEVHDKDVLVVLGKNEIGLSKPRVS